MRDPDRLNKFYAELRELHKRYCPDWRFGQLCSNFFGWLQYDKGIDLFFPEEEKMLEYFKEFLSDTTTHYDW